MQIDPIDRLERHPASAGGAAFHAEHRIERRLAQRRDRAVAELDEALRQPDGVDGLAFTLVVGVIAVTRISLPRRLGNRSSASSGSWRSRVRKVR
jgi:hypothetical protein